MFNWRSSTYETLEEDKPPPFRRLAHKATPVRGTIIAVCSVCQTRYQKRLDCEFFQCESCGALVTHALPMATYAPPAAQPVFQTTVVVTQRRIIERRKTITKKKAKGKRDDKSSSSSESESESSSESSSKRKKKHSSRKKIKELERQVKNLQAQGGGYNTCGKPGTDWGDPWGKAAPWPEAVPATQGFPALADAPADKISEPWPAWPTPEPMERKSAPSVPSQNPWPSSSSSGAPAGWPKPDTWMGPRSVQTQETTPWVAQRSPATSSSSTNPFGDYPHQRPNITINVPRDVASMSSDQLMMLAQAKRFAEQHEQQQQPLQLQFTNTGGKQHR